MTEPKKHCDTCIYSFFIEEKNIEVGYGYVQMQHCSNPIYNSPTYTHKMLLEDWGKGYCRLWQPVPEKGNENEKQLFNSPEKQPC